MDKILEHTIDAAKIAGKTIMRFYKTQLNVQEKSPNNPVTKADIAANDKIKDLLTSQYPKFGWLSEETKDSLDRLNKDSLFNKDYETVRILVDTHNITNKHPNNFDVGNYVFDLDSGTDNVTGGLGRYKNVIGFRLIHAIMPNAAYIINDNNKIVVYIIGSETITLTLKKGYIEGKMLLQESHVSEKNQKL